MAKINLNQYIRSLKNESNVKKYAKLTLKINYLEGLQLEYKEQDSIFLEQQEKLMQAYFEQSSILPRKRLSNVSLNDEKREQKLNTFDKRAYWARRKYLTFNKRKQDQSNLESLMNTYDTAKTLERSSYITKLDQKYPHHDLNEQEIKNYENKLIDFKKTYESRMNYVRIKHDKKHQKLASYFEKNNVYLSKIKEIQQALKKNIQTYEEELIHEEDQKLEALNQHLQTLEKTSESNKKNKQIELIKDKMSYLNTKKNMHNSTDIQLSVKNLKMYFGGIKAVNDLSFDVKKGEIFGLIGPNGAGKTTVFNCITQFYKATSGHIVFRNKEGNLINLNQRKTPDMIIEGIARSFQNVELIWELTVIDNLLVSAHTMLLTNYLEHMLHTNKMKREEKVIRNKGMRILKSLGIEEYAYRSPYGLPYGILKKIELARTLMTDPSLIILDEPAAGLNDAETANLAQVIKKINRDLGITIFLVEHDMGLVMSICDTICAISFGKMLAIGTPQEIQKNQDVRKAYLGDDSDE